MNGNKKISAHFIFTPQGVRSNPIVSITDDGTIAGIEYDADIDDRCGVEFYSGLLVPGFVNCHTHLELSHIEGLIPQGCGFVGFAEGMRRHRMDFPSQSRNRSYNFHDARMWEDGIALVADISNAADTIHIKSNSRIEYHTFIEAYGLSRTDVANSKAIFEQFICAGLSTSVTPHSTYSLNEDAFRDAINTGNGPLSIHFMESQGEKELYDDKGELYAWYQRDRMHTDFTTKYSSPAERIIKTIPSQRKILLVHNTFLSEEDLELLDGHFGRNITWVLCPRSNRYITGQLPPYGLLMRHNCLIALGTDSMASNRTLSILDEMKSLPDVPLETLLHWATSNGTYATARSDRYGSLEPGKSPGISVISGIDWHTLSLTDDSNIRRIL